MADLERHIPIHAHVCWNTTTKPGDVRRLKFTLLLYLVKLFTDSLFHRKSNYVCLEGVSDKLILGLNKGIVTHTNGQLL